MKQVTLTTISGPIVSQIQYFKEKESVEDYKADLANAFAKVGWEIANCKGCDREVKEWHNVLHLLTLYKDLIDDLHTEANMND